MPSAPISFIKLTKKQASDFWFLFLSLRTISHDSFAQNHVSAGLVLSTQKWGCPLRSCQKNASIWTVVDVRRARKQDHRESSSRRISYHGGPTACTNICETLPTGSTACTNPIHTLRRYQLYHVCPSVLLRSRSPTGAEKGPHHI